MLKDYVTVIVSMLLVVSIIGLVEIGNNSITGDVPNLENFPKIPPNKDAPIYIVGEKASIEDIKGVIETGTPSDLLDKEKDFGKVGEPSISEYEPSLTGGRISRAPRLPPLSPQQENKQSSNEKEEKNKPLPPKEPPEKSWWEKVKDWLFGTKTAVGTGPDIGLNDFPEDVRIMIKEQGGLLSLVEQDVGKIVVLNGNNANEYLLPGNGENIFTIVTDVKKGKYNIELSSKDGKRVVIKAKVEAGEEDKGSYVLTKAPTLAQNPLDDYSITTPPDKQGKSRLIAAGPIDNVETLQPLPRLPVGGIVTIGEDGKAQIATKDPEELSYRSVIKVNNPYGYTGDLEIGNEKTEIQPEITICLLDDEKEESKPLVLVAPTSNKVTAGVVSASRINGLLIERIDSTPLNPGCPEPEETHNFMLVNSISKEYYIPGEYKTNGDFVPMFKCRNLPNLDVPCDDEDSNELKEYAKEWCSQACSKQECHGNFKNINDVSKKSGGSTATLVSGSSEDINKAFKCKKNSARTCEQSYKCKCTKPAEGYEVCQAKVTRKELARGFNINVQPRSKTEICADLNKRIEKVEKEISTIPDFDPVYEMVSSTLKKLKAEYEKDCAEKKTGLVVPGTGKTEKTFLLPKNGEIIIGGEGSKCVALCKERELVAANSDGSVPVELSRKYSDDVLAQIETSVFECQDLAITYSAPEYVNDCLCFKDQAPRVESAGPTDQKCKTSCGLLSCGQIVTVDGKKCSCLHKGWEMDKDGNPVAIIGQ